MQNFEISYEIKIDGTKYITINGIRRKIYFDGRYESVSYPGFGTIRLHRLFMCLKEGRRLKRTEHVHHINHNKIDNSLENLEIVCSRAHNSYHTTLRNLKHDPKTFICRTCTSTKHKAYGLCDNCWSKQRRKIKAIRPCTKCGTETKRRQIYNGLCSKCSKSRFKACVECFRTLQELPKCGVNPNGFCRACSTRANRRKNKS